MGPHSAAMKIKHTLAYGESRQHKQNMEASEVNEIRFLTQHMREILQSWRELPVFKNDKYIDKAQVSPPFFLCFFTVIYT